MAPAPGNFLDALAPADRDELLAAVRPRTFARGESLFRGGADDDSFAVLLSGRVKLVGQTESGRTVLVALRGRGDLIGELAVLSGGPRSVDVIPVEAVRAGVGPGEVLRQFLERRPAALMVLCLILGDRLRAADRGLIEMAALPGDVRVEGLLLDLADRYGRADGDALHISVPLSQDELADWTGLSRQAVAKALATLRAEGLVDTARRRLLVSDLDALRRRVAARRADA